MPPRDRGRGPPGNEAARPIRDGMAGPNASNISSNGRASTPPVRFAQSHRPSPRLLRTAEIHFERLGVTLEQIEAWDLPTRPTKTSDTRSKGFGAISVELDAIEPNLLRAIVLEAIEEHLPEHQYKILKAAEESERTLIRQLVDRMGAAP